ncbi:MAG: NAD(P)/FAD-dependent oxidoreductase, partial [Betaproteobacteria bacterium]|nr:NAD(P)/FAD-dependent oxidoreductase [Betaproteobacteria bacterium]
AEQLRRAGGYQFLILEREDQVGGTWRDNRYPGCACDVPSHLYSLSFAPKADWQRRYATHYEIWKYLETVSTPLKPHLRLKACVMEAQFDEDQQHWRVVLQSGEILYSRLLMAGLGPLNRPRMPNLPGLDQFTGPCFHSMNWPDQVKLDGQRVAVIGTGASAIQIVPAIAGTVGNLTLFQRTAPWVISKNDRPYSRWMQRCFQIIPGWRWLYRAWLYASQEIHGLAFLWPALMRPVQVLAQHALLRQVHDPVLRQKLTPHYTMGCKRIMLSNDYFEALQRPNVALVTDPIARISPTSIITRTGEEYPADVLVLATGFRHAQVPEFPIIRGCAGLTLQTAWQHGRAAYLGTSVAGFPNFFLLAGPHSGLGHNSIIFMIEAQVHWILGALQAMKRTGARTIAVSDTSYQRAMDEMAQRSQRTVWQSGCQSWYLDERGHNTAIWPGLSVEFWLRTRRFKRCDFILEHYDIDPAQHVERHNAGLSAPPTRDQRRSTAA